MDEEDFLSNLQYEKEKLEYEMQEFYKEIDYCG